ncbi:hypothetical protein H0H87_008955 [Tephrocybe sp. NHM501043]|nr:hypothetical protein H0H87_008955 [Tephrocybe sp. NHM501043]
MSANWHASGEANVNVTTSLPLNVLIILFDRIARHLTISAVVCLSQMHPKLMGKLSPHLSKSLDELLTSRVSRENVDGFRTLLLRTRAAVSGSTVLHFILRDDHWTPGDFDLYAPFGTGYTVVQWLVKQEGYKVVSDGSRSFIFHPHTLTSTPNACDWTTDLVTSTSIHRQPGRAKKYDYSDSDIYRVYKLCSTKNTFIDVIESSKPSFLPPITRFHSTIVMNYLTPNSLVILYPKLTFRREGILQYRNENTLESYDNPNEQQSEDTTTRTPGERQDYVKKYKLRGFTLFSRPADLQKPCGAACPSLRRTASPSDGGDGWALSIPLARPLVHMSVTDSDADSITSLSPDISDNALMQIVGQTSTSGQVTSAPSSASDSQPHPTSSWTSSCFTDLSETFSNLSIALSNVEHVPMVTKLQRFHSINHFE